MQLKTSLIHPLRMSRIVQRGNESRSPACKVLYGNRCRWGFQNTEQQRTTTLSFAKNVLHCLLPSIIAKSITERASQQAMSKATSKYITNLNMMYSWCRKQLPCSKKEIHHLPLLAPTAYLASFQCRKQLCPFPKKNMKSNFY